MSSWKWGSNEFIRFSEAFLASNVQPISVFNPYTTCSTSLPFPTVIYMYMYLYMYFGSYVLIFCACTLCSLWLYLAIGTPVIILIWSPYTTIIQLTMWKESAHRAGLTWNTTLHLVIFFSGTVLLLFRLEDIATDIRISHWLEQSCTFNLVDNLNCNGYCTCTYPFGELVYIYLKRAVSPSAQT